MPPLSTPLRTQSGTSNNVPDHSACPKRADDDTDTYTEYLTEDAIFKKEIDEYTQYYNAYTKHYNANRLVVMQIGAFFLQNRAFW